MFAGVKEKCKSPVLYWMEKALNKGDITGVGRFVSVRWDWITNEIARVARFI